MVDRFGPWAAMRAAAISFTILLAASSAAAHGTLVNGRMYQVRVAGPGGHTPAVWSDSYYTWNQNSHNFPDYAALNFSYAATVANGTIAYAGINDGVQSGLNFTGLETPSASWVPTSATAGQSIALHWVATAPHDPSFFEVYLTKQGFEVATEHLQWSRLERLGRWSPNDSSHPVTNATAPSPAGGMSLSYDWNIPIPADRSGRHVVVVIWQRQDPAGEAFFAVQDLAIAARPADNLQLAFEPDGSATIRLEGLPNKSYQLEAKSDLSLGSWEPLGQGLTDNAGTLEFTDPEAPSFTRRFYRAVLLNP